jgi:hypothetical protein
VGGLVQILFATGPLIGASASVCAVMLALTTLFPDLPITALIFFVLPLRMRASTLGYGLVTVSILFWLSRLQPGVGHLAHLGGFATGWVFGLAYRGRLGEGGSRFISSIFGRQEAAPQSDMLRALPTLDDVLAKIQRYGIESLTREERQILAESRRRRS